MPHKFHLQFSLPLCSGSGYPITYQILVVTQMYDRYWKTNITNRTFSKPAPFFGSWHHHSFYQMGKPDHGIIFTLSPSPPPHIQLRLRLVGVLSNGSPVTSSVYSWTTASMATALTQALITCHSLCEHFPDWSFTSTLSAISPTWLITDFIAGLNECMALNKNTSKNILLVVWIWASYLTSLCLSFSICKMGDIVVSSFENC